MSLVLKVNVGEDIYVGDIKVRVTSITPGSIGVSCLGRHQRVTPDGVEILPGVTAIVGVRKGSSTARSSHLLVFKAPRDVVILRGKVKNCH